MATSRLYKLVATSKDFVFPHIAEEASALGISQGSWRKVVRGEPVTRTVIQKIARAIDYPAQMLAQEYPEAVTGYSRKRGCV